MKKILVFLFLLFTTSAFSQRVGTIVMSYNSVADTNELALDGSTFNAATYPILDSILGTNVLPDFRGRSPIGIGTGTGLSNTYTALTPYGEEKHALTVSELPSHNHEVNVKDANGSLKTPVNNFFSRVQGTNTNIYSNATPDATMGTSTIGYTGSNVSFQQVHPVQPVYFYIIAK